MTERIMIPRLDRRMTVSRPNRTSIRTDDLAAMADQLAEAFEVFATIERATSLDEIGALARAQMKELYNWRKEI